MHLLTEAELNDLYTLLNIIRANKSRRMGWTGHVARMRGKESYVKGYGGEA